MGLCAGNRPTERVKSLALQLLNKFGRHISAKVLIWGNFNMWERQRRHSARFTGLHCSVYLGLEEIAISLLEEEGGWGADIADGWGRTPLMWAAESGHAEMAKLLLLRKDVDPMAEHHSGGLPRVGMRGL